MGAGLRDEIFRVATETKNLKTIVVENFRLRPGKAAQQSWSELGTVKMIGSLEAIAWQLNVPLVYQEPSIKPMAYKQAGIEVPKNHAHSHATDAYAHGIYFLIKQGVVNPVSIMAAAGAI